MNKFKNKISGKRVAILGPADYVNKELSDQHGKYINNFDTVIRVNSMLKLPNDKLEKYYGTKFDILVSSFWPFNSHKHLIEGEYNSSRMINIENYKHITHNLLLFD